MAEKPEDLNLPNSVVLRIIKDALPDGVNVSKEARLAIAKAASVFVLYATSCSNNFALKAKRKTLTGQDVLSAMSEMEFDHFVKPLEESLEAYRQEQKGKKEAASVRRRKEKESQKMSEGGGGGERLEGDEEVEQEDVIQEEVVIADSGSD